MWPYRAVPARSRTVARETSAEVSSGGLAGSSFVGSLVNLFPGWRVGEGRGGQGEGSPASSCLRRGLCEKLLEAPLGVVWSRTLHLAGPMSGWARVGPRERGLPWEKE